MAARTLETCLEVLEKNTSQPEQFLRVQDALATDFTSLTKTLYDLHKAHKLAGCKGSPLDQLVVENFDEEQIWQELELQNSAVLTDFEEAVGQAVQDDTLTIFPETEEEEEGGDDGDGDGDEDDEDDSNEDLEEGEEEADDDDDEDDSENRLEPKSKAADEEDGLSDEDSDVDFDVDKLEKQAKQKKNVAKKLPKSRTVSEVDDTFFKLSEMEAFLEVMDKREGKESAGEEIDYFQELPSDEEDLNFDRPATSKSQKKSKSSRDVKYKDYFMDEETPEPMPDEEDESAPEDEDEGEENDDYDEMAEKIGELEKVALAEKPWQLSGEVTAQTRPENSMLEEDVAFDQASRMAPPVTEETTLQLEEIIRQRIRDQVWDDVVRKEKPKEEVFEYKKRLTLDHEKSKLSLAEVYEQEYLKQTQDKTEEENPAHVEIQKLMDTVFLKLDALSNFHFTPRPHVPEVKVVSNLPSIMMEEVAPVSASSTTLLAPEEIKEKNKAGDILGDSEKTATDKKRERRKKKKLKRLKIQEREKRKKLKEAAKGGENKKKSKAEVEATLRKLTKGGNAKILTDDGMDKALRSSQAFFSQLQDQVKSQIKGSKEQAAKKKKKQKPLSVSKLKL
uniref:U3 small nucleolar ribonucleoprotein protein MPP10 n=1 Tax=Pygocentrus nattereri TaxID=42514 RepID=A0A3B4CUM7_PYGNA